MIKRKPLPSSPLRRSARASASRTLSPSSDGGFDKPVPRISGFLKNCPICNAAMLNRNNALKRHIERHAKLAEIKAANIMSEPTRPNIEDFDLALARNMWLSQPAKNRAAGGAFTTGPLAGKGVFEGIPLVFFSNGRVKNKFMWIKKGLETRIGRAPLKDLKDTNAGAGLLDMDEDEDEDALE
ncbi:uncharacterized protein QYS62_009790 [Fusarium acuminatum]|uniref:C2H2-type domain-containing protein n=1 Tax=Fusarium acuminatum TaxID=5515 RepID=A0ABZ2X806_9HYPO